MKIWKRNAIIASVLLLVCAGVYLNWSKAQKTDVQDLTETLSAEQVMGEGTLVVADSESLPQEAVAASTNETQAADYFAQVRLSRQESRDSAVELLRGDDRLRRGHGGRRSRLPDAQQHCRHGAERSADRKSCDRQGVR